MDKATLTTALANSGGASQPDVDELLAKLIYLEQTGRYPRLLTTITAANDKSNFLALVLEATFAYHFESVGLPLVYEVRQDGSAVSSVDFLRKMAGGLELFLETRLVQQDAGTAASIQAQLKSSAGAEMPYYEILMNGDAERDEVVRVQRAILEKVQKQDGTPTKFLRVEPGLVNIVVLGISDIIAGMADINDCLLATLGDPVVREEWRRGIVGLFQQLDLNVEYPTWVHDRAKAYEHIQNTLHGVLFLFRTLGGGILNYQIEQCLVWNHRLIDRDKAMLIEQEIARAIPVHHPG